MKRKVKKCAVAVKSSSMGAFACNFELDSIGQFAKELIEVALNHGDEITISISPRCKLLRTRKRSRK